MQAGRRERNADTCNLRQSLVSQVGDDTAQSVHTIASDRRDDAKLGKMRGAVVKTGHRYESMRKALSTILLFVLLHDQALAETISSQPLPPQTCSPNITHEVAYGSTLTQSAALSRVAQ